MSAGVFAVIITFASVLSIISTRTTFYLAKLLAGMSWFGVLIAWITYPPYAFDAGTAAHTAFFVLFVGLGCMFPLMGLGRGIKKAQDQSGAYTITSEKFKFGLPTWLKESFESPQASQQRKANDRAARNVAYRERFHRALNPNEDNERRR